MKEKRIIVRKSPRARGGKTDWRRLASMPEREIKASAKSDRDAQPTDLEFWRNAQVETPVGKHPVTLRLDRDVLQWFRAQGHRYQSRMNAVLRLYMQAQRKAGLIDQNIPRRGED